MEALKKSLAKKQAPAAASAPALAGEAPVGKKTSSSSRATDLFRAEKGWKEGSRLIP